MMIGFRAISISVRISFYKGPGLLAFVGYNKFLA